MLKINLGSGQRPFDAPWVNVDTQERWNPDVVADGSNMPMFNDESAEVIVIHHVLEHFGCGEGIHMLRECYRILAPRGRLIVTVPDMAALVKGWVIGRINEQLFMTNIYGAYMGDEADRHKWGFTRDSLEDQIKKAGEWRYIVGYNFIPIEGANIAQDWWILAVEAMK